jgi:hypothetical protein
VPEVRRGLGRTYGGGSRILAMRVVGFDKP